MAILELETIAAQLEGLEETIINKLIDRAQFLRNEKVYIPGMSGFSGGGDSTLFQIRLRYQENIDAEFGRYEVPEERPYSKSLYEPRRSVSISETGLALNDYNLVNLTEKIHHAYVVFIPKFCLKGDDGQYGSSVEHDVMAFQAISRRIHFGALYVAEVKYSAAPDVYRAAIDNKNKEKLMSLLTRKEVEERILLRVREKVEYLQAKANRDVRVIIDPEAVLSFYRDTIIPLTKEGEILYLLNRPPS